MRINVFGIFKEKLVLKKKVRFLCHVEFFVPTTANQCSHLIVWSGLDAFRVFFKRYNNGEKLTTIAMQ